MRADRRPPLVALVVTGVGAIGFVVLAVLLVPWSPVPGGQVDPAPVSEYFTTEQVARGEDYARWARAWSWSSLAVSLLVAALLGFGPWGRRLVSRLPGRWWLQVVLAVAALAVIGRVVTLPFGVALQRHRAANDLTTQSWGGWLVDVVKGEVVALLVTSLVLLVLVGCARRWQRAWPAVAGGLLGSLVLLGSFAYPVVVEPLFNSFAPLPEGELRTEILELADREGVAVEEVLVADASRRTTTLNAYVSGLGGTRRVVVYDNLVEDLPREEALAVIAHELGHARHDDVLTGSLLGAAGVLTGVGLLSLLVGRRRMSDPRVVPLVLALLAVGGLAASPIENGISRQLETRADMDALRATGDPDAVIELQRQLALRSLADPTPPAWSQLWFGSHPTVLERIAVAERMRVG